MCQSSFDAEHAAAYQEAQQQGWKAADRHVIASRAARRKAKDPRRLWSFVEPSAEERAEVERIESQLKTTVNTGRSK